MGKFIDLTGKTYGRLQVTGYSHKDKGGRSYWMCKCECGKTTVVQGYDLKSGHTQSCGCYHLERTKGVNTKHGHYGEHLYAVWNTMKQRCSNPNNAKYKDYGGRGIVVCPEWQEFEPFCDWAMASGFKEGLTIERKDVNGNYEPSNCKWATTKEQANNTRRNHYITYNGETRTLTQWAEITGIKQGTLWARLKRGWPVEKALTKK